MQLKEVEVILQQHEDTLQQHADGDAPTAAAAAAPAAASAATDLLGRSAPPPPSRPTFSIGGTASPPRDGSESFGGLNAAQLVRHPGPPPLPHPRLAGPTHAC